MKVKVKKTEIIIGQVQINEIREKRNLMHGDNAAPGWRSHSKINYSLGRVNGDANLVACRLNYIERSGLHRHAGENRSRNPEARLRLKARLRTGSDARDEGDNNRQELTSVMKGSAVWLLGFGSVRSRLANSATTPG